MNRSFYKGLYNNENYWVHRSSFSILGGYMYWFRREYVYKEGEMRRQKVGMLPRLTCPSCVAVNCYLGLVSTILRVLPSSYLVIQMRIVCSSSYSPVTSTHLDSTMSEQSTFQKSLERLLPSSSIVTAYSFFLEQSNGCWWVLIQP